MDAHRPATGAYPATHVFIDVIDVNAPLTSPRDREPAANPAGALASLSVIPAQRRDLDSRELELIDAARRAGATWQQIACCLGHKDRQSAQQRHRTLAGQAARPSIGSRSPQAPAPPAWAPAGCGAPQTASDVTDSLTARRTPAPAISGHPLLPGEVPLPFNDDAATQPAGQAARAARTSDPPRRPATCSQLLSPIVAG